MVNACATALEPLQLRVKCSAANCSAPVNLARGPASMSCFRADAQPSEQVRPGAYAHRTNGSGAGTGAPPTDISTGCQAYDWGPTLLCAATLASPRTVARRFDAAHCSLLRSVGVVHNKFPVHSACASAKKCSTRLLVRPRPLRNIPVPSPLSGWSAV